MALRWSVKASPFGLEATGASLGSRTPRPAHQGNRL
jgi:hypothetical protein